MALLLSFLKLRMIFITNSFAMQLDTKFGYGKDRVHASLLTTNLKESISIKLKAII